MEQIFTVPRADFFDGAWPQGFVSLSAEEASSFERRCEELGRFEDRDPAEEDPSRKQPIPYCALRRGEELFTMQRLAKGSESRLRGRASIGVGGHIDAEDGPASGCLRRGLLREVREEVEISPSSAIADDTIQKARLIGLINDDRSPVGRVHIGFAFLLELPSHAEVHVRETEKMSGGFERLVGSDTLWQDSLTFESWSQVFLDVIRGAAETSIEFPSSDSPPTTNRKEL